MENSKNDNKKFSIPFAEMFYFMSDGLKDAKLMAGLIKESAKGSLGIHAQYYQLFELKKMVNSPADYLLLHRLKRYMHLITYNKNLPGEIFRSYPIHIELAKLEFREFLNYNSSSCSNSSVHEKKTQYKIECSNFGRVRIDGNIHKPIDEKPGWLYIHLDEYKYSVYRFVAETWCLCVDIDSNGWQVHHISNDGYDNTPGNLLWIKSDAHKEICTLREQKLKINYIDDENKIMKMIEEINNQGSD